LWYNFKRPSWFDLLSVWKLRYANEAEIKQLHCLAAFAFGELSNSIDSNADIAVIANQIDKPCVCQKEVTYYLEDFPDNLCIPIEAEDYLDLSYVDPRGPDYVNSYQVALAISKKCRKNGWKKIGILTVEPHQILCVWILRKLGFYAYAIDCSSVRYSPRNKQKWVRSKLLFTFYSIPTRIFFKFKGWI
jgi:hypothetical protein